MSLPGIAIIGSNATAQCLIPILQRFGFVIEGLWSGSETEASYLSKKYKIPHASSKIDEVLLQRNVQLVVLSCPPNVQLAFATKALGIGKHVLCSMPIAQSDVETMKALQPANYYMNQLLSLSFHGLRNHPALDKMRQLIQSGDIGDLHLLEARLECSQLVGRAAYDWRCEAVMGGGCLSLYGAPLVDALQYLSSGRTTQVSGLVRTFKRQTPHITGIRHITADDFCQLNLDILTHSTPSPARQRSGIAAKPSRFDAVVTVNALTHEQNVFDLKISVVGSDGLLTLHNSELTRCTLPDVVETLVDYLDPLEGVTHFVGDIDETVLCEVPLPLLQGLVHLGRQLHDTFLPPGGGGARPTITTFADAYHAQLVTTHARRSSAAREWVSTQGPCEDHMQLVKVQAPSDEMVTAMLCNRNSVGN